MINYIEAPYYSVPTVEEIKITDGIYLVATYNNENPKQVKLIAPKIGNGYCVDYAKYLTGSNLSGDAYEWKAYINSNEPKIGAIAVLDEGPIGHLAVVIGINNGAIIITEQNYLGRWIISRRELLLNYENIVGYVH